MSPQLTRSRAKAELPCRVVLKSKRQTRAEHAWGLAERAVGTGTEHPEVTPKSSQNDVQQALMSH